MDPLLGSALGQHCVEPWNCVFPLQEQHLAISSPARAVLGQKHQALVFPLLWVQEALSPPLTPAAWRKPYAQAQSQQPG